MWLSLVRRKSRNPLSLDDQLYSSHRVKRENLRVVPVPAAEPSAATICRRACEGAGAPHSSKARLAAAAVPPPCCC
jgi:hypothetical protein